MSESNLGQNKNKKSIELPWPNKILIDRSEFSDCHKIYTDKCNKDNENKTLCGSY